MAAAAFQLPVLDVNALIALGFINHEAHGRPAAWVQSQNSANLASCSITEIGLVRVLSQAPAYGFTVAQARLLRSKEACTSLLKFVPDEHDLSHLPGAEHVSKLLMVI
jgi:predicted nucleic acid-binding protein